MSDSAQMQHFQGMIEDALREAGLPDHPDQIVGRKYLFGCEYGSHHRIFAGTIQAIEISDEGGVDLHVSNPRFGSERLRSIKHSNGKWRAYVDPRPLELSDEELELMSEKEHDRLLAERISTRFAGEFQLL